MALSKEREGAARKDALADDHAALREGIFAGEVGVWRWDVASDRLVWSGNMEAIHHVPRGGHDGRFASYARASTPMDGSASSASCQASGGDRYAVQFDCARC